MTLRFRPGAMEDLRAAYDVFVQATADLERRMLGTEDGANVWRSSEWVEDFWRRRRPLFEHLARTSDRFWVAERDGKVVGFARSSVRDGVRELLEFFVLPEHQGGGIGRELLERAFPAEGASRRAIIATAYIGALARYLKAGVYPRFPIYYFFRKPEQVETVNTDLVFIPVDATPETLAEIRAIDRTVLGYTRDADHEFLLHDRRAYLFRRHDRVVGYGYFGSGAGPVALLDETDYPAVLARAESEAAVNGDEDFGAHVPLVNRAAVDRLLSRGFRMEPFTVFLMSDEPFGQFERYIITNPPFFI